MYSCSAKVIDRKTFDRKPHHFPYKYCLKIHLVFRQNFYVQTSNLMLKLFMYFSRLKVSQSKRLKSDIATLEYDLAALKKVGAQQRNDLKQIGNLIMSELKSLREKTLQHEESLNKECKISQKFTQDLPVMVTTIR